MSVRTEEKFNNYFYFTFARFYAGFTCFAKKENAARM